MASKHQLLTIVGLSGLGAVGISVEGASGAMTLAELREIAAARDAAIADLSVSYSFNGVGEPVDNLVWVDENVFVIADAQVYRHRLISNAGGATTSTVRESAWDGSVLTDHIPHMAQAMVMDEPPDHSLLDVEGIFEFWLARPAGVGAKQMVGPELVDYLDEPGATLRAEPVEIDGVLCHVVDVPRADGSPYATLYLDAQRDCLPVRQEHHGAFGGMLMTLDILDAEQIDGFWVPTAGVKSVFPAVGYERDVTAMHVKAMEVARDDQGQALVAINQGVDPAIFQLHAWLPPGTLVAAPDGNYIASGDRYDRLGAGAVALAANFQLDLPHPVASLPRPILPAPGEVQVAEVEPAIGASVALWGGAALVGLGMILAVPMAHRPRQAHEA